MGLGFMKLKIIYMKNKDKWSILT